MAEGDRELLVAFLIDLRKFVYQLLDTYNEIFAEAGALGRRTWDGLEPNHWALIALLQGQDVESWPGPGERPAYELGALDRELAERGLTGTPLQFKLHGFYRARNEWEQQQALPPVVKKGTLRRFVGGYDVCQRCRGPSGRVSLSPNVASSGATSGSSHWPRSFM